MSDGSTNLNSPVIDARGLHKRYDTTIAVDGLDLKVHAGQIFGLVGPDGAGKSTTLKILSGLVKPDEGQCFVLGCDVVRHSDALGGRRGFVPQGLGLTLSGRLTVRQNMNFFADLYHIDKDLAAKRREQLLTLTQLVQFEKRLARDLSGGMQQKLALCCALIHHPKVLILDEPTTGVDPVARRDLWIMINDLVSEEGIAVVIATSYLDEAERCHRVVMMHNGKVLLRGNPETLPTENGFDTLQDFFVDRLEGQTEHHLKTETITIEPRAAKVIPGEKKPVATISGLVKRFGKFTAVDHIDFEIAAGSIFGFLGPNGAGKTTAIKILCGIMPMTEGEAYLAGFHVWKQRKQLKSRIGYMSQKFSLYRDLTVVENIELYRKIYGRWSKDLMTRNQLLDVVGLHGKENRLTNDLPTGLQQRLALACTMVHTPDMLFLDEPTSGVDPLIRERFWDIVTFLSRQLGITVLLTTHYMDEAEYCDRIAMINFGKLVAIGTPDELKDRVHREKGALVEITCGPYQRAKKLIEGNIAPAAFFGRRLHTFTTDAEQDIEQIRHLLAEHDISDVKVRTIPIRLEDVFIHFARQGQQHGA